MPFREHRGYVHSASLCNCLAARFPDCTRFELVLKKWMDSRVVFTPVEAVRPGQGSGHARITHGRAEVVLELSEDKDHPVGKREPYDEDALVDPAEIEGRSFTCHPRAGGSFYDRLIAANKALINDCLNPGVKLIAAKIAIAGQPSDTAVFTIDLVSNVGTRIFKSRVSMDGSEAGEIIYYGQ